MSELLSQSIQSLGSMLASPARAVSRRLSGNAVAVANMLYPLPSAVAAAPSAEPVAALPPPVPAPAAALPPPKQQKRRASTPAAISNKAPSKRSPLVKIKQEQQRELPFRAKRTRKCGFYSESNLTALAWKGEGSSGDPIVL